MLRSHIWALVVLALLVRPETLPATERDKAIAVFINEGHAPIQVNVISEDKTDTTVFPLRPGQMERTLFARGHVELYTASKDIVSGRLLFTRSMPTPISAPEFMEPHIRTFYFRVTGRKISLVKPTALSPRERGRIDERTRQGW